MIWCGLLYCCGMGFGMFGLVGFFGIGYKVNGDDWVNLLKLKVLYFLSCVKYVIYLFMNGGLLYVDMFDFKLVLVRYVGENFFVFNLWIERKMGVVFFLFFEF